MQDIPEDDLPISKTRRKQEMLDLQKMGERLVTLGLDQIAQIDLPEELARALREAKKINKHGALRRQFQYIGKLMRNVDIAPIQAKLDIWDGISYQEKAKLHQLERLRQRLLEDESALSELVDKYPVSDIQYLRTLIRNAHKEQSTNRPPKSSRALFKALRELMLMEETSPTLVDGARQD